MGWIDIEECEKKLNARESLLMGEKPRVEKVVTNRKILDKLERAVEAIPENELFSVTELARRNGTYKGRMKNYIQSWCEDNNKKLVSIVGKNGGSMIKENEDE